MFLKIPLSTFHFGLLSFEIPIHRKNPWMITKCFGAVSNGSRIETTSLNTWSPSYNRSTEHPNPNRSCYPNPMSSWRCWSPRSWAWCRIHLDRVAHKRDRSNHDKRRGERLRHCDASRVCRGGRRRARGRCRDRELKCRHKNSALITLLRVVYCNVHVSTIKVVNYAYHLNLWLGS